MPIVFVERAESRKVNLGDNPGVTLEYVLSGTSDDVTAVQTATLSTPLLFQGFWRQSIEVEPEWVNESAQDGLWNVRIRYGVRTLPDDALSTYTFDTTGGQAHITQSLATVGRYALKGKTAPHFKGAVGVTPDGIQGCDVVSRACQFSETHHVAYAMCGLAYRVMLYRMTGKTNNAPFKGCAAGECLFLGAAGSQRGSELWEVTYRFSVSENRTDITVGEITGISKKGWEYLWVRYADQEDTVAKALVKRPVAVYVEQVFESADFSLLGIGV